MKDKGRNTNAVFVFVGVTDVNGTSIRDARERDCERIKAKGKRDRLLSH
jgi:hypothetical protein